MRIISEPHAKIVIYHKISDKTLCVHTKFTRKHYGLELPNIKPNVKAEEAEAGSAEG